jgi:hypothetical protein
MDTENNKIRYDKFWATDISVLVRRDRLDEFYPTSKMSFAEKLNATVRLSVYIAIVLLIFGCSYLSLYIPIAVMLASYFMNAYNAKKVAEKYQNLKKECVMPTSNNPFMNVLLTDLKNAKDRKRACTANDDHSTMNEIDKNFDINLYKNVDDVWNKQNSQRQYFTMPWTTIPNNQTDLATWLYHTGPTLKERGILNE